MAKLSKPPIPLKMYKHFAVVTLMLTAGIAMFADSGNREAMAAHIEERQREAELRAISAQRTGNASQGQIIRRDAAQNGWFGSEDSEYGDPTVEVQSNGGGSPRARRGGTSRAAIAGYPTDYIASLPEQEYRELLAQIPPTGAAPTAAEQQSQQAAIIAASARRSGRRGAGSDAPE